MNVVNRNIRRQQYICAGNKSCLDILRRVCNAIHEDATLRDKMHDRETRQAATESLLDITCSTISSTGSALMLKRGSGTIPLRGIDVPFHSPVLASYKPQARRALVEAIASSNVHPDELVGKWIPNVTGTWFSLDDDYVRRVQELTGSLELAEVFHRISSSIAAT